MYKVLVVAAVLFSSALPLAAQAAPPASSVVNPLLPSGPDPWVIYHSGSYYYMNTTGSNLVIRRSTTIGGLATAERKVVWQAPPSGPYSHGIWAPELHFINGKWYIYFSADAGTNQTHRLWVIENASPDPLTGEWTMKGKIADPEDRWAIDGSVFEHRGEYYFIWSGWEGATNGTQSIYIAEMLNPWTIKGNRVLISSPSFPWEKVGDRNLKRDPEVNPADYVEPLHVEVNEGPQILKRGDKLFLIYSANGCWSDYYSLGMLTASATSNLLSPGSWKKSPKAVFWHSPAAKAWAPGHNSFFKSPDGKEDWIIYHANSESGQGCGGRRSPRAQPFTWNADGTPNFGRPVPVGSPIAPPSGETRLY